MSTTVNDLEKTVNSGLTTNVKRSEINFNQLFIDVDVEDIISTILFLKTNEKCRFRQLIDITAVDYPQREKRFKIVYLLLIFFFVTNEFTNFIFFIFSFKLFFNCIFALLYNSLSPSICIPLQLKYFNRLVVLHSVPLSDPISINFFVLIPI